MFAIIGSPVPHPDCDIENPEQINSVIQTGAHAEFYQAYWMGTVHSPSRASVLPSPCRY